MPDSVGGFSFAIAAVPGTHSTCPNGCSVQGLTRSTNVSFRITASGATGLLHTTGCCMASNVNRVLCEKDVSIEN
jgi:hypothetical protein